MSTDGGREHSFLRNPIRRTFAAILAATAALPITFLAPAPVANAAARAFTPRFAKDISGDLTFVSNTLMTCPTATACTTGQNGGNAINNNFAMVFVDRDSDATTFNSSRSALNLPAGAAVQFAGLYWGARSSNAARNQVRFKEPGATTYTTLTATTLDELGVPYQGFVDVTDRVAAAGNGDYWVANVQANTGADTYAGWSIVIVYSAPGQKTRNCTVFDGINTVSGTVAPTINVSGFRTPPTGQVNTKLGTIAYEGDRGSTGDSMRLNNVLMTDAANPSNDYFNSSISANGSNLGGKDPNFVNQFGYDADILAVPNPSNSVIANGATSAQIKLNSSGDVYYPGVVTFCTDLYAPQIVSDKVGVDTTPDTPLLPGDEIEYTISVKNIGEDPAIDAVVNDPVPTWTTLVPGSISIATGPNAGSKTDATGDDQAEFAGGRVTVRIGAGATATSGGTLPISTTTDPPFTTVKFRVQVSPTAPDGVPIVNAATIDYAGFTLRSASVAASTAAVIPIQNNADLAISKTNGATSVTPGTDVAYTIIVQNTSTSVAVNNAQVNDAVPAMLGSVTWTCVASSGSNCDNAAGSGSIASTVDLAPGGTATFTLVGRLDPGASGSLTNTASVTPPGGSSDPNATNNSASDADPIAAGGDLSITKTNGANSVAPGGQTTWTITATNTGPATAVGAAVTDTFDASVLNATWTCAGSNGATCPPSGSGSLAASVTLPAGGSATFTVVGTLAPAAMGSLANTAKIAAPAGFVESNTTNNESTDTDPYAAAADLSVSKTHTPTPIVPGQPATWTITVNNNGPSVAPSASVTDNMPVGITAVAVASSTWDCAITGGGTGIDCDATALQPGLSTIVVNTTTDPALSGPSIANTATATSPTDTNLTNNAGTDSAVVTPISGLSISKAHLPTTLLAGTRATWILQVANAGPSSAANVTVNDILPAGVTLVSVSGGGCSALPCDLGTMAPSTNQTITIVGDIDPTATGTLNGSARELVNVATVSTSTVGDNPADNTATDRAPLQLQADIGVTKSRVGTLTAGAPITYTVTVYNEGPSAAPGVVVNDTIPAEIENAEWSCLGTGGASCATPGPVTSSSIATTVDLPVGGKATFTITGDAAASASGTVTNTATITPPASITDASTANNAARDTSNVAVRTALSVTKSNSAAALIPGTSTTYTVVVRNAGPSTATGAPFTDNVLADTNIASASWTCAPIAACATSSGSGNIATSVTLLPNTQATFTVIANIDPNATASDTITNTATIAAATGAMDPDANDNSATDTDPATPVSDLSITKTDAKTTAVPGDTTSYTIVVSNTGPSSAMNVPVNDTLSPTIVGSATWTCAPVANCDDDSGNGSIATTVDLPPNSTATFTVNATIDPAARGTLSNTATLTVPAGTLDPTPLDSTANDTTTLTPKADISVTKTASPNPGVPGQDITYTVTVANAGPSTATGVSVNDPTPMGIASQTWTCASGACTGATGVGTLNTTVDLAAGDNAVYTVTARVDPSAIGTVTNVVDATMPSDVEDPIPGDLRAETITPLSPTADVTIVKTGPATASAGDLVSWSIVVSNAGPSAAPGTTVSDAVSSVIRDVSWTCTATSGSSCAAPTGLGGIATSADLAPIGSATFTLTGRIDPGATISSLTNTANAAPGAGITDPTPANADNATTTVSRTADLSLVKASTAATATPGSSHTYTVTVTNAGPSIATGARVTDTLPASLRDASWSCAASAGSLCAGGAGGTGNLDTTVNLAPAGTATFTIIATVDPWLASSAPTDVVNTASVVAPAGVTDPGGNNTDDETDPASPIADVSVTKTNGMTEIVPGTSTTYTISIKNSGPSAVRNVSLIDAIAAPFDVAAAVWNCGTIGDPPSGCAAGNGTGPIATTVNLAPNDIATFKITVPVLASATGSATNTATISLPTHVTDPTTADHTAFDTDTLTPKADLTLTKTNNATSLVPGNGVTYTITVTNPGPSDAPAAPVSDTLPAALTNATWTCTSVGGSCASTIGSGSISSNVSLPAGTSATFLVSATIDPLATGTLANEASVAAPAGVEDTNPLNNTMRDSDPLVPTADVQITKTNSATSQVPGEPTSYTITVRNAGPSAAPGVRVLDPATAPLTPLSWTCTNGTGGTCASTSGIGALDSTADLNATGEVIYTVFANVDSAATGNAVNTAQVLLPSGITDPDTSNNTAVDTDLLTPSADLAITKTHAPLTVVPGESMTYTIIVSNAGPSAAPGVQIDDVLPSSLRTPTWTCTAENGATCSAASGNGSPSLQASLPKTGAVTIVVSALVDSAHVGDLVNTAKATLPSTVLDPTPGPQPGVSTGTDIAPTRPRADLSIAKTDNATEAVPGSAHTYSVVVRNDGPSSAPDVAMSDTVPSSLQNVTWSCTATGNANCDQASGSGDVVTTADFAPGTTVTYTIRGTISASATGTISNTATLTVPSSIDDPDIDDQRADDQTTLTPKADLLVTKTHAPETLTPGLPVTYAVKVTNRGPSAATGTSVMDSLPLALRDAQWTCVAEPGASCTDASGTGSIATTVDLAANTTATFNIVAVVASNATGSILNTVAATLAPGITDPTPGPAPGSTVANDTAPLQPKVELSIAKTYSPTLLVPGSGITYSIVVRNDGPSAAPGVTVNDALPSAIVNASWTCSASPGSSCVTQSGTGSLATMADLASSGTATYTVIGTIASSATGRIDNTAALTVPVGLDDPTSNDHRSTAGDDLVPTADLRIEKSHSPEPLVPGEAVRYTLRVTNDGPSDVRAARVVDTLPNVIRNASWLCSVCATASGTGNVDTLLDLASGASATVTIDATLDPAATGSTANEASVFAPNGVTDPNGSNNIADDSATSAPRSDVMVTKTRTPVSLVPGGDVTYTIRVSNQGPSHAPGVRVNDPLPASLQNAKWTCAPSSGTATCASTDGDGSPELDVNLTAGSSIDIVVRAQIDQLARGTLANSATATLPTGVTETVPNNNVGTSSGTLAPTTDLSVTKTHAPNPAIPGRAITYTIVVRNAGPSAAIAASVRDMLPASVLGAVWTCVATPGSRCVNAVGAGDIDTTIDLQAGAIATFTVTASVDPAATGSIQNTATVAAPADSTDPDVRNQKASDTAPLQPTAYLSIAKTDGIDTVTPGNAVTYQIVVRNSGPSVVVAAPVSDTLPTSLINATWVCSSTDGGTCTATSGIGSIGTTVNLPPNASTVFVVTATLRPDTTGVLENTAIVNAPNGVVDPDPADNRATDRNGIGPVADLSVVKSNNADSTAPGTPTTWMITVTNNGPSTAPSSRILDNLPVAATNATWNCATCTPGTGTGDVDTLVDLAPGAAVTVSVTATIDASASGSLANVASVATALGVSDPDPTNNYAEDSDLLRPRAALTITKTAVGEFTAGANARWQIIVKNDGPSTAPAARVIDALPTGVVAASWQCVPVDGAPTSTQCSVERGTGSIDTTVSLPSTGAVRFTIDATLDPAFTGSLANTARVIAPTGVIDDVPSDDSATAAREVSRRADLSVTKVRRGELLAGRAATYVITARNAGPSTARNVVLTDVLPNTLSNAVWTCAGFGGGICSATSGAATANVVEVIVDLPPGGSTIVEVTAAVDRVPGEIVNTATLRASNVSDPTPDDHSATDRGDSAAIDVIVVTPPIPTEPPSAETNPAETSSSEPNISSPSTAAPSTAAPTNATSTSTRSASPTIAPTPTSLPPGVVAPPSSIAGQLTNPNLDTGTPTTTRTTAGIETATDTGVTTNRPSGDIEGLNQVRDLSLTGSPARSLARIALGVLAFGCALVIATRRRPHRRR